MEENRNEKLILELDRPFFRVTTVVHLFLSKKMKKEMHHCSNSKKWSVQLQDELLQKITPEFQREFPQYRLGVSALKQTWEKLQYFSTQIQGEKESLTQDGKLNIPFFIKENLKTASKQRQACHIHPYHYAHQLAVNMSECIAVVDGIRPKIDQLTRTIWSLQRHLIPELPPEHFRSPYDENDKMDTLIVKSILEIGSSHPDISQTELAYYVAKRIWDLEKLVDTYTGAEIKKMLTAIWTDLTDFPTHRMEKTLREIPYSVAKQLKNELATLLIDTPTLKGEQVIQETVSFFQKARAALQPFTEEEIDQKIQTWTMQGDMLLRWIRMNHGSRLLQDIEKQWTKQGSHDLESFISELRKTYLEKYPILNSFSPYLLKRAWIYLKYIWYTQTFGEETPTYDRFILWHKQILHAKELAPHELIEKIENLAKTTLPLLPFQRTRVQTVVFTEEKGKPEDEHRDAEQLAHI